MSKRGKANKGRITKKRVQATENQPVPPVIPQVEVKAEEDNDPWDAEGLTVRQRLFVDKLTGEAGGNATRAAELAGYAAENRQSLYQTASRLLSFVKVREAIARRMAAANLTPEWVRQMTAALAASSMGSFMSLDAEGNPKIDWRAAERMGAFVQIRKYKEKGMDGGPVRIITERQIETHNPAPYIQLLARMTGVVQDVPGVTVNVTQMSEDDLVRIATRDNAAAGGNRSLEAPAGTAEPTGVRECD